MKGLLSVLTAPALRSAFLPILALPAMLAAQAAPAIEVEFTNPGLVPPHWKLTLHPDGAGQFDAEAGQPAAPDRNQILAGDMHRSLQLSQAFTDHAFAVARERNLFAFPCESHLKVAFQGAKRLSYTGAEGSGACEFNYSKDKEIQQLGESFLAIENTVVFGARLEKLLQHDRLGLDQEMDSLAAAVHDGNAIEIGAIRETLTKLAQDDQVLDRARRKARMLLIQAH